MFQTDNAQEPTEPTTNSGSSGASETVTLLRTELEELIASSVQHAFGQKQDSASELGAGGVKYLLIRE